MVSDNKDSPCIALCSTALGDPVCRGCGRTFHEVARWCVMDATEKRYTWERLPERLRLVEIGLCLDALIDIEEQDGVEWACIVGEGAARPLFRLQRGAAGWQLLLMRQQGLSAAYALPEGVAASAEAFARLFVERE